MTSYALHQYGSPMRNYKGSGFIVASTDGSLISDEVATYDEALDKASDFLDAPKPAVVIFEAVAFIKPKRDVVARMTKRGAELEDQRISRAKALGSGPTTLPVDRDYDGEASQEVNEIAPDAGPHP